VQAINNVYGLATMTDASPWGVSPVPADQGDIIEYGTVGGEMGGGGGHGRSSTATQPAAGGSGGIVVEWFYD
jgi:uncharacterized spore protein YtfJ